MKRLSMRSFAYLALLSFVLVGLSAVQGCKNPFKTRESPPPVSTEGTWETPGLPQIVIQNLLLAYNEKVIGNFIQCLCDSFTFSAPEDSVDAANEGRYDLFSRWDRSVEIIVTTGIFNTSRQRPDSFDYVLRFRPNPGLPDQVEDTLAVVSRDYELLIFDLKSDPAETSSARGTSTFHMRQTSLNWWSIYFWTDVPAEAGGADWADFKAQFRQ